MSRQLMEFSLENGKSIFVEEIGSDEVRRGETEASLMGDIRDKIKIPFKEAMEATRGVTEIIIQQIDSLKNSPNCPKEIDVEFGIKLGSKIGVPIISSLDSEVNLKITLKWKK